MCKIADLSPAAAAHPKFATHCRCPQQMQNCRSNPWKLICHAYLPVQPSLPRAVLFGKGVAYTSSVALMATDEAESRRVWALARQTAKTAVVKIDVVAKFDTLVRSTNFGSTLQGIYEDLQGQLTHDAVETACSVRDAKSVKEHLLE